MDAAYLRVLARCCRDLSEECFDLTVAGKLRRLSESVEARAREIERVESAHGIGSGLAAFGRWVRHIGHRAYYGTNGVHR
jgi:hypothetical protein